MAKTRRKYKGNATATTIPSGLAAGATLCTVAAATGWPIAGPFYAVIDPGTSSEEKILVGSISGTSLSSITRGVDDTTDQTHQSGCSIYPVFTAVDADEANELASTWTTKGDLVTHGSSTFARLAAGTNNHVLMADSTQTAGLKYALVGASNLDSDAVTTAKILDGAVTSAKIENNTIVNGDINPSAAIALSKLATASDAQIIVHNSSGVPTAVTMSGDATISNTGAVTIANNAITTGKIANGAIIDEDIKSDAAIALTKLGTGELPTTITVKSANIVNGTITADDLGTDSVTAVKIKNGEITAAKLASTLYPVYISTTTTGLPTTDGTIAYINTGTASEGIQTYNGSSWTRPWNLPWGAVAVQSLSSNVTTSGTTETDLNSVASVDLIQNRRYKFTWSGCWVASAGSTDAFDFRFNYGVTTPSPSFIQIGKPFRVQGTTNNDYVPSGTYVTYFTPSSTLSNQTVKVTVKRGVGSGTLTVGATLYGAYLIIEDMGPDGNPV